MRKFFVLIAFLSFCAGASAKLEVRQPCSDGMVLQQNCLAVVWGKGNPGRSVSVVTSWNGEEYSSKIDQNGYWQVPVSTPEASYKHYSVEIRSGGEKLTIRNVLIGEVWLASGQSNMEMPMSGFFNCPVRGAAEVISAAPSRDRVRMFKVPRARSYERVSEVKGEWWLADPSTVPQMSAVAFFFARKLSESLDVPVGIVFSAYGGTKVESWIPEEVVKGYPDVKTDRASIEALKSDYHSPFMMYNAMICPVAGYTIKGIIWYQGCSNVSDYETYSDRLAKMVSIWREDWGDDDAEIPFYQVEIAPYRYKHPDTGKSAFLRKAQLDALKIIPNSGIAVTNDLSESYEMDQIHPSRKLEVGERLSYLALNRDYGFKSIACDSPEAVRVFRKEDAKGEIFVELKNCPNGLDRWQEIEGLEVAGSEGIFKPVSFAYYDWNPKALRIRCEGVRDPCKVRYGWGDFKPGNLHNTEGLPIAPFNLSME